MMLMLTDAALLSDPRFAGLVCPHPLINTARVSPSAASVVSDSSPVTIRRLAEFLPRMDRDTLLDADHSTRQVIAMDLILDKIRWTREYMSDPEPTTGLRWLLRERPASQVDEEIMRYLHFKQVLPLQLLQDDGLLLRSLYLDSVAAAPIAWVGRMNRWHEFVGRQVTTVTPNYVVCRMCTCGDTPLTFNLARLTHPDGRSTGFLLPTFFPQAVNKVDDAGRTIAHIAASVGHEHCLRLAHSLGADVGRADAQGHTPAQMACAAGHTTCFEFLLSVETSSAFVGIHRDDEVRGGVLPTPSAQSRPMTHVLRPAFAA